jgi:hypothetical protein
MAAAVLALVVANSPLALHYAALFDFLLEVKIGTFGIAKFLITPQPLEGRVGGRSLISANLLYCMPGRA